VGNVPDVAVPYFVHDYSESINDFCDPCFHTFKGNFSIHWAVERPVIWIRRRLLDIDACPVYSILQAFMGIFLGLNCGFPAKDVALYTVWYLRGCK